MRSPGGRTAPRCCGSTGTTCTRARSRASTRSSARRRVARPDLTFGIADHYVPTRGRAGAFADPGRRAWSHLEANTGDNGIMLMGLRRSAPGHRACGRAGAGADAARPADRVRRQPHVDARRARRYRDRHRRLGSRARAADADALAEEAEAHARHGRRQARPPASARRTSRSRSSPGSAPTARRATRSNMPAARSARSRWKAA